MLSGGHLTAWSRKTTVLLDIKEERGEKKCRKKYYAALDKIKVAGDRYPAGSDAVKRVGK